MKTPKASASRGLWAIAILAIAAGALVYAKWPQSDGALRAVLIGSWRAEDPTNAALHHRKGPVQSEDVIFTADGRLTYVVQMKSDEKPPAGEPWGWEIEKGRLVLRDLGAGSTQERQKPLPISINGSQLSISRKTYPTKVFQRV